MDWILINLLKMFLSPRYQQNGLGIFGLCRVEFANSYAAGGLKVANTK